MKIRTATIALLAAALPCVVTAAPSYRITLRGNSTVISRDQPVVRGSVVLFHRASDGQITGLPQEEVASIEAFDGKSKVTTRTTRTTRTTKTIRPASAAGSALPAATGTAVPANGVRPLAPGETLAIGPTGAGSAPATGAQGKPGAMQAGTASSNADIHAKAAVEAQVFPGDLPAPAGGGSGSSGTTAINPILNTTADGTTVNGTTNVNGATTSAAPQPGAVPPIGANGFPTTGPTTTSNPNGTTTTTNPNGTTTTTSPNGTTTTNPNGTTTNPNGTTTNPNGTNNNNGGVNNGTGTSGTTTAPPAAAPAKGGKGGKS